MNKLIVVLAILTGSVATYAYDDATYSDNYTDTNKPTYYNDSNRSVSDSAISDETSVNQSSTVRDQAPANVDNTYGSSTNSSSRYTNDSYSDEAHSGMSATNRDTTYGSAQNATTTEGSNRISGTIPAVKEVEPGTERWSVGLLSGINSPKGEEVKATPAFGLNIDFQPIVPFAFGVEAMTARLDDVNDFQRTSVLAKGTFNFGGGIPLLKDMYLGAGAGPVFVASEIEWAAAPMAGFDIPLQKRAHDFLSLGVNTEYQFVTNSPDSLIAGLALKYWF